MITIKNQWSYTFFSNKILSSYSSPSSLYEIGRRKKRVI